jgi:EAL domain-containing protein (putative c-di-GMP-specific phosphodiesterase class I)
LIKHADSAMYQAKERGRNNYQFFAGNMSNQAVARQTIEAELRVALERHEFVLHYQPKVNLASGAITGTEALLRWNHPQLGQLQPSRFVSIAEDCGLIVEIGRWVLHEACKQACKWRESELLCGPMAVNVSALEFRDKGFVASLEDILAQTGLPANALQLELSESALMREAQFSTQVLQQLHGLGVLLAVDEFGTGYSSLTQLAQFPLDVLKIDQSFVQKLDAQDDNRVIVSALIAMGSSLKLRLVAEGVENPAQLAFLKGQRCEEGQGFLFSPPLAAERMSALLLRGIRPLTFSGRE